MCVCVGIVRCCGKLIFLCECIAYLQCSDSPRNAPVIIIVDITEAQYTVTCIAEAESEKRKKQDSLDGESLDYLR